MASATSLSAADVNVMNYGAKQDTTVLSTKAIQKAIDACAASGGGPDFGALKSRNFLTS